MPLLARCCGKAVRLCIPTPYDALGIQGVTSPHDPISVWAFMWNIASPPPYFTPFFQVVTLPPLDSLTQLRNATIRNVGVGGGESEAVRTQLGQTHCTPLCLRREVSVTVREFHWREVLVSWQPSWQNWPELLKKLDDCALKEYFLTGTNTAQAYGFKTPI